MSQGNLLFDVGTLIAPTPTGKLPAITVVAKLHHIVDANTAVAVVIVVGLPDGTEAIHRNFPVVAEVPAESLKIRTILVTTENHALLIGFPTVVHLVAGFVDDRFAILILDLPSSVAEVKVKLTVRTKVNGVYAMVVLGAGYAGKKICLGIGLIVPVLVGEYDHAVSHRYHYLVPENTNAMGRIDVTALIKSLYLVRLVVAVRVL